MSILESKNGDQLHLEHLGVDLDTFSWTQRPDGTVFEVEGSSMGAFERAEQALGLMMGPGFSAGDEVEWKGAEEGGVPVTVTIIQWEFHPSIKKERWANGQFSGEVTPNRWKLWLHQKPADTGEDNPRPPLGFLSQTTGGR